MSLDLSDFYIFLGNFISAGMIKVSSMVLKRVLRYVVVGDIAGEGHSIEDKIKRDMFLVELIASIDIVRPFICLYGCLSDRRLQFSRRFLPACGTKLGHSCHYI